MTIDDVLKADIPEGKFKLALKKMCGDIQCFKNTELFAGECDALTDSLAAAFEALIRLEEAKDDAYIDGLENGRASERERILGIVEDATLTVENKETLEGIVKRIEEGK